jgi:hypothetical protein
MFALYLIRFEGIVVVVVGGGGEEEEDGEGSTKALEVSSQSSHP